MATNKAELNLLMAVRKAISMEETSPKQKHVRTCIMNTWDNKSSRVFWAALKNLPFLSNEIQCFKALITIHKVIRQGHPATLTEAINEKKWIENLPRMLITDQFEYAGLIKEYVQFISYKLDFHRLHSDFNSTFDYEEYTSMKELSDVNEGYETIFELMELLDRVDQLQIFIFSSMRNAVTNECRLAAVVPLIEESYAIYRFVTSMLRAIHVRVGSMDALESLREKYINQHHMLRKFYDHSRRFVYITSLVTIPELPSTPPSFYDAEALPKMNSSFPLTSDKDEAEDFVLLNKGSDAMIPIAQNTLVAAQPQPQAPIVKSFQQLEVYFQ
ncbi:sla2 Src-like adaptor 2 [Coelomomyces lativittatus]|nr:sla2 Src-like adaptor 2 [Coelomomyces lativittatus]